MITWNWVQGSFAGFALALLILNWLPVVRRTSSRVSLYLNSIVALGLIVLSVTGMLPAASWSRTVARGLNVALFALFVVVVVFRRRLS